MSKEQFINDTEGMVKETELFTIDYIANMIDELQIPGDIVETGVYKGCCSIYMALRMPDRTLWACDSFEGFDDPEQEIYKNPPRRKLIKQRQQPQGSISIDGTKTYCLQNCLDNFKKYGLDPESERIHIIKGYFRETLPPPGLEQISLLRMDADKYSATMETFTALYPLVVKGGFIILDDFCVNGAFTATYDFVRQQGLKIEPFAGRSTRIGNPLEPVPKWSHMNKRARLAMRGIWWRKL